MTPFDAPEGVDAHVTGSTLVVTIAAGASLDRADARRVNRGFVHELAERDLTGCLTVLRDDDPLRSAAFEEVERAAAAAVSQGVERWAVVVGESAPGAAFADHLEGIETRVFGDVEDALAWTNGD
ncbi:MAG: hypothetical protein ABEJ88_09990 [Halobacterium sp.]